MEGLFLSVNGTNITVKGSSSSFLDGHGAPYLDGLANGGGAIKPKFFKANNLTTSALECITILNAPLNSFSISHIANLLRRDIIIDNGAGDFGIGYNPDAFDITTPTTWSLLVQGCGIRTTVSQL